MEDTFLYDLVETALWKFREKLKNKTDGNFYEEVKKAQKKLESELNEKQLKLAYDYAHSVLMREEYIQLSYDIRVLNYGVRIGMQLQKAFDSYEG